MAVLNVLTIVSLALAGGIGVMFAERPPAP